MTIQRRTIVHAGIAGLLGGHAFAQPASGKDIVIGQVTSLSGSNGADLGQGLQLGIRALLESVNAKGGVNSRKLSLVSLDDKYVPDETVRLTRELIETHKPVALAGYRGTANTIALIKSNVLKETGVPLVGTLTGAAEVQGAPMVYHLRTSYPQEISQLVQQLVRLGMTRLGLFYVDDAFGKSGREAVLSAAAEVKAQITVEASYDKAPNKVEASVQAAADKLAAATPQAVVMVAVGDPVYSFIQAVKTLSPSIRLFSISVVNPSAVIDKVGLDMARGIGFSQVFPFPYSSSTLLVREYHEALKQLAPEIAPNYFSLEGYVYAKILVDAIRRAGAQPTPASVMAALDTYPPRDLGGFAVKFDPGTRNGSNFSDLTIIGSRGRLMK